MRLKIFLLTALLAALALPLTARAGNNWGKWGPDDQLGTLNYITPQVRTNAAKMVRSGKVFNVAIDLKKNAPGWPGRTFLHLFEFKFAGLAKDGGGVGASDDLIIMHQQVSTQWDAFPHFAYDGKMYNGFSYDEVSMAGAAKNSIHLWADRVVTRGVLIDVARYKGVDNLEKGYVITPADLDGALKAQKVKVQSGDCLLIRTGWINKLREQAWPMRGNEPYEFGEPGPGYAATQWLKEKQVACIALDSLAVEPIPFDPEGVEKVMDKEPKIFPIHVELLVNQGMPIGEIFDFEALAKDSAADGQYDFMFVAPPLRIVGGVGSPLSPVAIK
jgi:kynurenine formamidase